MTGPNGAAGNGQPSGGEATWNPATLLQQYVKRGVDYVYDDIVAAIIW